MKKIKLLFDMEVLSTSYKKGTGVYRVSDVLFHKLVDNPLIDIYPLVTLKNGDIKGYLQHTGLPDLTNKIVYMPELKSATKWDWLYLRIRSFILNKFLSLKYSKLLHQFDCYFSPFNPIPPVIEKSNLKTLMLIHDLIPIYYPHDSAKNFIKKFTQWIKRTNADNYLVISNYTIQELLKFRPDLKDKPINKMYLGADDRFKPINDISIINSTKQKYNITSAKYFLAVSELTTRKNFVHLLKSFVKFLENTKANDIYLVLVGPVRKGYEEVSKQVDNIELYKDKIIQTGYIDNEDLAPLYNGALAFVYPSLYEGFGLPVLEAMQCGTPVVSADNTSLPEVGGDAVLYVSGHDEEQTASVLAKVYNDSGLRSELSAKGLSRAKEFSWDKTSAILIDTILKQCNKDN